MASSGSRQCPWCGGRLERAAAVRLVVWVVGGFVNRDTGEGLERREQPCQVLACSTCEYVVEVPGNRPGPDGLPSTVNRSGKSRHDRTRQGNHGCQQPSISSGNPSISENS